MDDLLAKWRQEQLEIAEQVEVKPDEEYLNQQHTLPAILRDYRAHSWSDTKHHDKLVGGVDISFGAGNHAIAVYVILKHCEVIYQDSLAFELTQPYVSSYLAFREIEPLRTLIQRQCDQTPDVTPDVIMVDGNGILHERRAGIACFVGILTGIPTVGVGKTVYCTDGLTVDITEQGVVHHVQTLAKYLLSHKEDDKSRNNTTNGDGVSDTNNAVVLMSSIHPINPRDGVLQQHEEMTVEEALAVFSQHKYSGLAIPLQSGEEPNGGTILGVALVGHGGRTQHQKRQQQTGTKKPIYISVGHGLSLQEAVELCCDLSLTRIPEPVRQADLIGRELIRQEQ